MNEYSIEHARAEHAEAIAELLRRNREVETLLLLPAELVRRRIEDFVLARGRYGELLGCAQLRWHRPHIAELMSVAVDPEHHGRGIGRALVRACVNRALDGDAELLWLATTSPEFFERLGFEEISMRTVPLPVLLAKLRTLVRQPLTRWPAALFGGQIFMRWPPGRSVRAPQIEVTPTRTGHDAAP